LPGIKRICQWLLWLAEAPTKHPAAVKKASSRSEFRQTNATGCIEKKALRPTHLKGLANNLIDNYRVSCKRACGVVMLHRSVWYYKLKGRDSTVVRKRMQEIAGVRIRYGFEGS